MERAHPNSAYDREVVTLVHRGSVGDAQWETATRQLAAPLRAVVSRLQGYEERSPGGSVREELPSSHVVVIIETGPPLIQRRPTDTAGSRYVGGFVAGLGPGVTETRHDGLQRGIQINLTPSHARRVLGVPLHELAGRTVALTDLLAPGDRSLPQRIAEAPDWEHQTDIAERWVRDRLSRGPAADRRIAGALKAIVDSGGTVDIARVRQHAGLSRPHLVRLFREHVGVPPKQFARLVRFDRIVTAIRTASTTAWAALAADVGCYDQAHLAREVRSLASMTPSALAELLGQSELPTG